MKIIEVNENWIEHANVLFSGYRNAYCQENDLDKSKQFLQDRIRNKESVILMALADNEVPAGFVQMYPMFSSISCSKDYTLKDLFVAEDYRRNGIATSLLEKAKSYSYEKEGNGLAVEIDKENPAIRLYDKLGWHSNNGGSHYYWKANSYPRVEQKYINPTIGFGVFAIEDIKEGDFVLRGKSIYTTDVRDHKTLQISETVHSRLDTPFENANHSCDPNTGVRENDFEGYDLFAIKDIKKGNQITFDYCMTEWESVLGTCACNTKACRQEINGAKYMEREAFTKYNGFVANYMKVKWAENE